MDLDRRGHLDAYRECIDDIEEYEEGDAEAADGLVYQIQYLVG